MPPQKRGRASSKEAGAPAKAGSPAKKGRHTSTAPASAKKSRIEWRLLQDTVPSEKLDFDAVDEDDFDENDAHTAHCDALLRSSTLTESLQQGASAAGLIDEVVAISDVFASQVEAQADKTELGLVQQLEAGAVPEEALPRTIRTVLGRAELTGKHDDVSEDDEPALAAKLQSAKELEGLYGAFAARQAAAGTEEEEVDPVQPVGNEAADEPLRVGSTFSSMEIAAHKVRLQSSVRMLVVPGTSKKCKIWCCHSNKCAHNAEGDREAPSDDGSRATSHHAGGCAALVQVRGCEHEPGSHMPEPEPLTLIQPLPPLQVQEVTVQQLRQGTWSRTSFTKQVYGASHSEWDDVTRHSVQRNPLPSFPDACPTLLPVSKVYAG